MSLKKTDRFSFLKRLKCLQFVKTSLIDVPRNREQLVDLQNRQFLAFTERYDFFCLFIFLTF